ncbi:hypothetical protein FR483_N327L [Paramecium bursaria Chlorella virus FR483]|uniref:Uncharacterized protein N327L n=1 Tax=Paramecium bursaria Chlorella virus FR483 TaxID=399781 RepID=A7J731_PBCVF|nr:hypothetical protein FR483_N327L [Paramecium bursaria Chlorella virus FR483]ABT15612.1 hypothetical protein FR483_N327L [Paramecium bursaria Chlorella virus FR483]
MIISTHQNIKGAFCSQRTSPHHQPSAHKNKQTNTPETPKANNCQRTKEKQNSYIRMAIFTAKTFEPSNIKFAPVEKNKLGGKYVPLADVNGAKTRLTIQTPAMHLPFGISGYRERPDAEPTSYSADLSFRDMDTNENLATLFNKINELDTHLVDAAVENSVSWFGKKKSRELLEDTYRKLTKVDPSGKYAPVMKFKIPMLNGKPNVQIFDTDKKPISVEDVPKGAKVKVIAEVASIWFIGSGTSWGISFRAVQILIVSKPARLDAFAFVAEDGDEEEVPKELAIVSDEDEDNLKFL